uniref:Uncharacterized protein n=1 Tax=Anguilla anguilla TaxID=7936 RepID=A0A0E9TZD7_ANGAN
MCPIMGSNPLLMSLCLLLPCLYDINQ